ncbi:MAG: hypothetical protein AAF762_03715 [Pseudomonadota bacterium]
MRVFLILALLATPAAALELRMTGSYELNRPASLEYDPAFCGLWIANEGPETILVTLNGDELRRFSSDLRRIKAIALDGDGLILADGFGGLQRVEKDGTPKGAPFQVSDTYADTEGIVALEDGTLITVEDDPERLSWFSPEGELIRRINTLQLDPPIFEAQGIALDPRTGHLLIVDDLEGTNSLYEFNDAGEMLAQVSLREYGIDPEGIAIRPGSGQMFIAFDQGARIVSFDYTPTLPEGAEPLQPAADCMMF